MVDLYPFLQYVQVESYQVFLFFLDLQACHGVQNGMFYRQLAHTFEINALETAKINERANNEQEFTTRLHKVEVSGETSPATHRSFVAIK